MNLLQISLLVLITSLVGEAKKAHPSIPRPPPQEEHEPSRFKVLILGHVYFLTNNDDDTKAADKDRFEDDDDDDFRAHVPPPRAYFPANGDYSFSLDANDVTTAVNNNPSEDTGDSLRNTQPTRDPAPLSRI